MLNHEMYLMKCLQPLGRAEARNHGKILMRMGCYCGVFVRSHTGKMCGKRLECDGKRFP